MKGFIWLIFLMLMASLYGCNDDQPTTNEADAPKVIVISDTSQMAKQAVVDFQADTPKFYFFTLTAPTKEFVDTAAFYQIKVITRNDVPNIAEVEYNEMIKKEFLKKYKFAFDELLRVD